MDKIRKKPAININDIKLRPLNLGKVNVFETRSCTAGMHFKPKV